MGRYDEDDARVANSKVRLSADERAAHPSPLPMTPISTHSPLPPSLPLFSSRRNTLPSKTPSIPTMTITRIRIVPPSLLAALSVACGVGLGFGPFVVLLIGVGLF